MNPPAMLPVNRRGRPARWVGLLFAIALGTAIALVFGGGLSGGESLQVGLTVAAEIRADPRDTPGSPLEMLDATLVQRDVRMVLRVTTAGIWKAADLEAMPGRVICLGFGRGVPAVAFGGVCMTRLDGHPALTYTPLAADGTPGTTRKIGATIQRPRSVVLEATFLPAAAGLS